MTAWLLVMLIGSGYKGHTVVHEFSTEAECHRVASEIENRVNRSRILDYDVKHTCVEFQK